MAQECQQESDVQVEGTSTQIKVNQNWSHNTIRMLVSPNIAKGLQKMRGKQRTL
jgi:hypothetical protein